jgi:hypothetical protein
VETIKLKAHINAEGILTIEVPPQFKNKEAEIVVILNEISASQSEPLDAMGYPIGYFENTFGILADDPIERGEQGTFEIREALE